MVFSSTVFLFLFLPLVLGFYFSIPGIRFRNLFLLFASLFFYAWGENVVVWLAIASIGVNYFLALAIANNPHPPARKFILAIAIGVNLGFLAWFKYSTFLGETARAIAPQLIFFVPSVVSLPLGISFFTFQALSYVADVYRQQVKVQNNPLNLALYIFFFPQLIAGPIVRYLDLEKQLIKRSISIEIFATGVRRFILGLGKKMLIANTLAVPVNAIFSLPSQGLNSSVAWLGITCYTLQIYFDFSGYSDMAIGLGLLFGFQLPENFNYPYISQSIREFWQRWHISLSSWFRDYLYIPLGGNRCSRTRTYLNLFIVFFLCGLWHGASWNFALWGLFHGSFIVIERLMLRRSLFFPKPKLLEWMGLAVRHLYALLVVMVGWIFFRAETLDDAGYFLSAMVGLNKGTSMESVGNYFNVEIGLTMIVGAIASTPVLPYLLNCYQKFRKNCKPKIDIIIQGLISVAEITAFALLFLASISKLAAQTYQPFIYFRF